MKVYVGIDNGVTGSIGVVGRGTTFALTPVRKEQSYTKKKQMISRVDVLEMQRLLLESIGDECLVILERPLVNPQMFKATMSAIRCLEATLTILESLQIPYEYVDSKQWQKALLPQGCKGKELKDASRDIGIRLFPQFEEEIRKHGDADGLLMAEWARREGR